MEENNSNAPTKSGFKGLKIQTKTEDMIGYMYIVLRQYPKSEKFVLAAETKRAALELMELIISCNKHYMKKTTMRDMDIQLDTLRAMVRLGHTLGFLKNHPYEVLSGKIDEIGRMIGGWMKSIQS